MANRRSVLIGLGGLVAGGGALVGTGAFDTVEAQRTVTVETAGDSDALLGLAPADRDPDEDDTQNEYVTENDDGLIEINLDGNDDQDATGLNRQARTRFDELVDVTNNGTQDVATLEFELAVEDTDNNDAHENAFKIVASDDDGTETFNPTSDTAVDVLSEVEPNGDSGLNVGQTVTLGVEIDLLNVTAIDAISEDASFTLTVIAESAN